MAWNRRSGNEESVRVYGTFARALLAGLPLGGVLWFWRRALLQWIDPASFYGSVVVIVATAALFAGCMALGGWLFKVEAIHYVGARLRERLRPSDNPPQHSPEA
jgi:hypothetical protein